MAIECAATIVSPRSAVFTKEVLIVHREVVDGSLAQYFDTGHKALCPVSAERLDAGQCLAGDRRHALYAADYVDWCGVLGASASFDICSS